MMPCRPGRTCRDIRGHVEQYLQEWPVRRRRPSRTGDLAKPVLPERTKSLPFMRRMYHTLASTIIFESDRIDADGWREEESASFKALDERPKSVRRQIRFFLLMCRVAEARDYAI